jgi:hypothetical protein
LRSRASTGRGPPTGAVADSLDEAKAAFRAAEEAAGSRLSGKADLKCAGRLCVLMTHLCHKPGGGGDRDSAVQQGCLPTPSGCYPSVEHRSG